MRTRFIRLAAAVAASAALGGLAAPLAHASTEAAGPARSERSCFTTTNWDGWTPAPGGDALYIRVNMRDIYRVDLTPGTHARKFADHFLVNVVRGSNWICSPLDLDLTISDHMGFRQPLIARGLHKLSPEEIAAIPRKDLP
jgi:hypothetical protein